MNISNLSKAEMQKMLESMITAQSSGLTVKLTSETNLYIRHNTFQAWSTKKEKYYTYGLNINYEVAKVLFNDDALLAQIKEQLNNIK